MLAFCESLSSLLCWEASVEVLKIIKPRRFSAGDSLCEIRVSEIIFLTLRTNSVSWYSVFLILG